MTTDPTRPTKQSTLGSDLITGTGPGAATTTAPGSRAGGRTALVLAIFNETGLGRSILIEPPFRGTSGVRIRVTHRDINGKIEAAQSIDEGTLYDADHTGDEVLAFAIGVCGQRLTQRELY